jgi:hypothetical protein
VNLTQELTTEDRRGRRGNNRNEVSDGRFEISNLKSALPNLNLSSASSPVLCGSNKPCGIDLSQGLEVKAN